MRNEEIRIRMDAGEALEAIHAYEGTEGREVSTRQEYLEAMRRGESAKAHRLGY